MVEISDMMDNSFHVHILQICLKRVLNYLLSCSHISDDSNFFNSLVNFEIASIDCAPILFYCPVDASYISDESKAVMSLISAVWSNFFEFQFPWKSTTQNLNYHINYNKVEELIGV